MARIIHNTIWVETGTLQHEGAHRPGQRVIDDEGRQWFPTTPPLALSRTIAGAQPHDWVVLKASNTQPPGPKMPSCSPARATASCFAGSTAKESRNNDEKAMALQYTESRFAVDRLASKKCLAGALWLQKTKR